ncbi:MAG: UbiD family decarboxylase [Phycisphaerales bacterium]|nr:UbiD family decarboxylase [Phycisphaerales bacterium]
MPAQDFQTLVAELEQRGWLRRVRVEVDPILEISEIADRTVKSGGPALLFERVRGSNIPVLINTFGTKQRMCHALGVDDFQQLADRVKALIKPEMPTTLLEKIKKLPQLIALGSLPPKIVRRGICQEIVHRDDADLTALPAIKCWPGDGDLTRNAYAHVTQAMRSAGGRDSDDALRQATNTSSKSAISVTEGSELAREYFGEAGFLNHGPETTGNATAGHPKSEIRDFKTPNLSELLPPRNDGRYLTLTNVFTKNPHTGERNIGMYRVQVLGPKLAAMHWHMHHDGARHFRMHRELGKRMPVAVSFGGPAVMPYAATCPLPPGIDECLFAGFLNGGAIELVPCVTQPEIEVPASAEIVVEGYIDPQDAPVIEGPFGDHTGFYSLADLYPRLHVTAITQRRNPIYPTTIVGKPPQEDFWLGKATERIFLPLLQTIIPDIIDYNLPTFGCFHNCAFVKIKKEYPYQARRVMSAIWGAGQMCFTKMIVVVDAHVNVQDENEVLFHMLANCDPRRDCVITDGPLDILDHASPGCGVGSKIGWDATRKWPAEGAVRTWPDELEMSPEIRELVTRRWKEYGL